MKWPRVFALSVLSCCFILLAPLGSAEQHVKQTKSLFEKLMGDCKQAISRPRHLRPADRDDLRVLGDAYTKNIPFLKKDPLYHIPHQMHLIWIGPRLFPEESIENVRSFRKYHPDWIMNFWTDSPDRQPPIPGMVQRLVTNDYFLPIFDLYTRSTNYGEKSDYYVLSLCTKRVGSISTTMLRAFDHLNRLPTTLTMLPPVSGCNTTMASTRISLLPSDCSSANRATPSCRKAGYWLKSAGIQCQTTLLIKPGNV